MAIRRSSGVAPHPVEDVHLQQVENGSSAALSTRGTRGPRATPRACPGRLRSPRTEPAKASSTLRSQGHLPESDRRLPRDQTTSSACVARPASPWPAASSTPTAARRRHGPHRPRSPGTPSATNRQPSGCRILPTGGRGARRRADAGRRPSARAACSACSHHAGHRTRWQCTSFQHRKTH